MEFARFVYKTHGNAAIVMAIAAILHLWFFLTPSHSFEHWTTWVAFTAFILCVGWFGIGYVAFKDTVVKLPSN